MYNYRELQATPADYVAFKELIKQFRDTEYNEQEFYQTLSEINKSSTIIIVENSETKKMIATATIIFEHKFIFNRAIYAHIEDVCVDETVRGQGWGKRIMEHCVLKAKERDCYKITLDCADNNVGFYLKCGLEKRGNQMCNLLSNL